jgi:hypothetical protein
MEYRRIVLLRTSCNIVLPSISKSQKLFLSLKFINCTFLWNSISIQSGYIVWLLKSLSKILNMLEENRYCDCQGYIRSPRHCAFRGDKEYKGNCMPGLHCSFVCGLYNDASSTETVGHSIGFSDGWITINEMERSSLAAQHLTARTEDAENFRYNSRWPDRDSKWASPVNGVASWPAYSVIRCLCWYGGINENDAVGGLWFLALH